MNNLFRSRHGWPRALVASVCALMLADASAQAASSGVSATVLLNLSVPGVQAGVQSGAQGQVQASPPASSLLNRIQTATGTPVSPSARRYLMSRLPEALPTDAGWCRDQDRTFGLEHQSYGSQSPRARRLLNDCSPALAPTFGAP